MNNFCSPQGKRQGGAFKKTTKNISYNSNIISYFFQCIFMCFDPVTPVFFYILYFLYTMYSMALYIDPGGGGARAPCPLNSP